MASSVDTGSGLADDPKLYAVLGLAGVGVFASTLVSPALPGMASAFDLTEARVGMVMTAFFLTAVVAIPIVGSLTDALGRRRVFLTSLVVYGLAGVAIAFVDSFAVIILLRAIQGCAFPGLLPMSITLIGDLYEGRAATTAQGFLTSITGLVGVASPLLAGALVDVSWRLPFALYGLSFVAFVLCYVWLPEPESAPANGSSAAAASGVPSLSRVLELVREVAAALTREMRIVIVGVGVLFLVRYALFTFVPLYAVTVLGTSEFVGGLAVAVLGLGRLLAAPTAGRLVGRVGRRAVLVGSLLLFGAGTAALLLTRDPVLVLIILGIASIGDGLFDPVANDAVTAAAAPDVRGRVVSVLEVGKTGAISVSPVAFGVLLSASSYSVLFLTGTVVLALTAVVVGLVLDGGP
ncbi:MFS transporter [Natronolimnohabitans innermongolicus]|uniref:Major facilitator superfamily protein n=1 Tax=Natronolimnohabitans innermongolicus JCM 12255 TaxID=1227499 RepID=L9WZE4_9EURY|nr:MFS transporter [Natronolimnohabitans innermongolicus]ELY54772.1 major facilitator superfamily protein [Natronolimnohabitans innermongolicus JCM 12255]